MVVSGQWSVGMRVSLSESGSGALMNKCGISNGISPIRVKRLGWCFMSTDSDIDISFVH